MTAVEIITLSIRFCTTLLGISIIIFIVLFLLDKTNNRRLK